LVPAEKEDTGSQEKINSRSPCITSPEERYTEIWGNRKFKITTLSCNWFPPRKEIRDLRKKKFKISVYYLSV
jgi:hypothetical protein